MIMKSGPVDVVGLSRDKLEKNKGMVLGKRSSRSSL